MSWGRVIADHLGLMRMSDQTTKRRGRSPATKPNGLDGRTRNNRQARDGTDTCRQRKDVGTSGQAICRQKRPGCERKFKSHHAREQVRHTSVQILDDARGHSGSASGCPTRTTEGNARLKRVCSGPRFSNDEIELHGVAPESDTARRWHANAKRFAGWDCVGSQQGDLSPWQMPPPPKCLRPTDGHSSTSTRTTRHARPRWTPRWETGRVSEVARLIGMVSLTGHSLGDSLTPTTTPHEDKQDTKPRAKCLAGLGKALPDVAGCVGGVF